MAAPNRICLMTGIKSANHVRAHCEECRKKKMWIDNHRESRKLSRSAFQHTEYSKARKRAYNQTEKGKQHILNHNERLKGTGPRYAASILHYRIRTKQIPPAKAFKCADCGKQAQDYDHRDYLKPLEVEPVCRRCNQLRGRGKNYLRTGNEQIRKRGHCKQGHYLLDGNAYEYSGRRFCKICARIREKKYITKKKLLSMNVENKEIN